MQTRRRAQCSCRTRLVGGLLRPAAAVRWPAGFGDRLPDDGSLLEPSKCAVRLLSTHSLDPRAEFRFEIQTANSFGDAPIGTQRLVLVVASAVSVLSEETIFVSPNQTMVTISRLAPSTFGGRTMSACRIPQQDIGKNSMARHSCWLLERRQVAKWSSPNWSRRAFPLIRIS